MTNIKQVRDRAWHYLSPDIACAAGMTLAELQQFARSLHANTRADRAAGAPHGSSQVTEATGTDIIRAALRNRAAHGHLAATARDLGVAISALEEFCYGQANLPPEKLAALAKDLFPFAEWDEATDMMRPLNRTPPVSMGIRPEPFKRKPLPVTTGAPPIGPQPVVPQQLTETKRAGWLGGFF